jgi:hypothetical protein
MPEGKGQSGRGKRPRDGNREKRRPGLPDPAAIVEVNRFTSPKGKRYRIIRTTEKDPYDDENSDEGKR